MKRLPYIVAMLVLFFPSRELFSQNSRVEWSAFSSGFAVPSSSTTAVKSSVGQALVGSSQLANTLVESGFLANPLLRGPLVGVPEQELLPTTYGLNQNYPNPFNPTTVIRYQIPVSSMVSLKVYNVLGQEVATLVSEEMKPGRYEVAWDATGFASGVYFYRLQAKDFVDTKKLILLK